MRRSNSMPPTAGTSRGTSRSGHPSSSRSAARTPRSGRVSGSSSSGPSVPVVQRTAASANHPWRLFGLSNTPSFMDSGGAVPSDSMLQSILLLTQCQTQFLKVGFWNQCCHTSPYLNKQVQQEHLARQTSAMERIADALEHFASRKSSPGGAPSSKRKAVPENGPMKRRRKESSLLEVRQAFFLAVILNACKRVCYDLAT